MMRSLFLALIRFYQRFVSPYLGSRCRFYPSCSQYCFDAIVRYGVIIGIWRGFLRLCRCHPFHPGGYDPLC